MAASGMPGPRTADFCRRLPLTGPAAGPAALRCRARRAGGSYGWIDGRDARYVSVVTGDGSEPLIPDEGRMANRGESWSHSKNGFGGRAPARHAA
jgi:hypothetical protein